MSVITVLVNKESVYEFNREITLDDDQLAFFDKMDRDMKNGIKIYGELIKQPDRLQCATFVAMNLIKALQQANKAVVTSSCAYLVTRYPALFEVRAYDHDNLIKIDLIEEHS